MQDTTIVRVPFETEYITRPALLNSLDGSMHCDDETGRQFTIRAADTDGQRSSASILINKMYATRGYRSSFLPAAGTPERITLVATDDDVTIGTLTIGFDSSEGLLADQLFSSETDELRDAGRSVCEFIKLAIDSSVRSRRVLASLFHVAFICAHRLRGTDNVVIEVNPRHVRYYERMLGFKVAGPQRLNPRVDAPAVLLDLDLCYGSSQIDRFGGQPEYALVERSLYPYFFSAHEQAGIVRRLQRKQPARMSIPRQHSTPQPQYATA
ncbi:long-chain N-acyl amino acid synthase [Methylibium sp.]|uniref:N-acyl amino acid synthase FeeM domain-containing protein n=1 Tax=Methylibium sp. TaxID=2067992 RepID=UPI0017D0F06E|nr:long-chain N-acyl amino acid synthase [Methylibium sp.]MBA3589318.1 long-chain N-acyl amino acid synthase [Methylibium sp.]